MSKNHAHKNPTATVTVKLKCFYSGFEGEPGPGAVIELDSEEAARLIEIGAAEAVEAPAAEGE
jgi:hypothetical protein